MLVWTIPKYIERDTPISLEPYEYLGRNHINIYIYLESYKVKASVICNKVNTDLLYYILKKITNLKELVNINSLYLEKLNLLEGKTIKDEHYNNVYQTGLEITSTFNEKYKLTKSKSLQLKIEAIYKEAIIINTYNNNKFLFQFELFFDEKIDIFILLELLKKIDSMQINEINELYRSSLNVRNQKQKQIEF